MLRMRRNAFTLIELLIVIAIIAFLAGLLVAGAAYLRRRAAIVDVTQRIDAVTQALSRLGAGSGGVTMSLQGLIPTFGGTRRFTPNPAAPDDPVAPTHDCFPKAGTATSSPLVMAYPWGRARTYVINEPWYINATSVDHPIDGWTPITWPASPPGELKDDYGNKYRKFTNAEREEWAKPEPHGLSEFRPHLSLELLVAAGILDDVSAATVLASPAKRKAWNDPWGNPLVVAYAIFQPPKCVPDANDQTGKRSDYYLARAEETYGYSRSTFVAVGAVGPKPKEALPDNFTPAQLSTYLKSSWKQINEVCNDADQAAPFVDQWQTSATENAFTNPPWKGVLLKERANTRGDFSLLSAPVEFK